MSRTDQRAIPPRSSGQLLSGQQIHGFPALGIRVVEPALRAAGHRGTAAAPGQPFRMKEGKWTGAKMGFASEASDRDGGRGWVDADWFRVCQGTSL